MIITQLNGGLGNQLFQYAMARRVSHNSGQPLKLDIEKFNNCELRTYRLNHFNIQEKLATPQDKKHLRILRRQDPIALALSLLDCFRPLHRKRIVRETTFRFQPELLRIQGPAYLDGDWQSPKYFQDIKDLLQRELTLKAPLEPEDLAARKRILDAGESVSVHVRRGDLASDPKTQRLHGTLEVAYYKKAITRMNEAMTNPAFFIFSDDPDWAMSNLPVDGLNVEPVFHNKAEKDYADLHLMSLCRHHIIANSTFSWWAAWLAQNPEKKIFHPREWFRAGHHDTADLFPEGWIPIK